MPSIRCEDYVTYRCLLAIFYVLVDVVSCNARDEREKRC